MTELVCWATGGPQKYSGRSMTESHQHLSITTEEWAAFLDDVQQTLDKFGVLAAQQAELKAIVESTRGDIVTGDPASQTAGSYLSEPLSKLLVLRSKLRRA